MIQTRILAIEDDPIAAKSLWLAIEALDHIPIDIVDDVVVFRRLVKATRPDLLIFDIDLGTDLNGIDLAREMALAYDIPFLYITSQHDRELVAEAVQSFPAAFLTKPFDAASLQAAIALACSSKPASSPVISSSATKSALFLKDETGFIRIDPEDLLYIEASNKQCRLILEQQEKLVTGKITELSHQLPMEQFMQVHRSFVVNLEKIRQIDSQFKSLDMNGKQVPVGRSYKESLMTRLLKIG